MLILAGQENDMRYLAIGLLALLSSCGGTPEDQARRAAMARAYLMSRPAEQPMFVQTAPVRQPVNTNCVNVGGTLSCMSY